MTEPLRRLVLEHAEAGKIAAQAAAEGTRSMFQDGLAKALGGITTIEVTGPSADRVLERLYGFPEVRRLHTTNGRWDIVAEIESDSLEAFDETLRRIRLLEGIAATETSLLLSERKST